jgi:hypothetical protein
MNCYENRSRLALKRPAIFIGSGRPQGDDELLANSAGTWRRAPARPRNVAAAWNDACSIVRRRATAGREPGATEFANSSSSPCGRPLPMKMAGRFKARRDLFS